MCAIAETQTAAPMDARDAADRAVNLLEPDFVTVNLPTTLPLPWMKSSRIRLSERVYLGGSWTPRVAGFGPNALLKRWH